MDPACTWRWHSYSDCLYPPLNPPPYLLKSQTKLHAPLLPRPLPDFRTHQEPSDQLSPLSDPSLPLPPPLGPLTNPHQDQPAVR